MGYDPKELIRVQDLGELRPGMTVVVKACSACHDARDHAIILVRQNQRGPHGHDKHDLRLCKEQCWDVAQVVHTERAADWCFAWTLREGRLFRLKPPEDEANPYLAVAAPPDRRPALLIPLRQLARQGKIEP